MEHFLSAALYLPTDKAIPDAVQRLNRALRGSLIDKPVAMEDTPAFALNIIIKTAEKNDRIATDQLSLTANSNGEKWESLIRA